jgi:hypothetical protein
MLFSENTEKRFFYNLSWSTLDNTSPQKGKHGIIINNSKLNK